MPAEHLTERDPLTVPDHVPARPGFFKPGDAKVYVDCRFSLAQLKNMLCAVRHDLRQSQRSDASFRRRHGYAHVGPSGRETKGTKIAVLAELEVVLAGLVGGP